MHAVWCIYKVCSISFKLFIDFYNYEYSGTSTVHYYWVVSCEINKLKIQIKAIFLFKLFLFNESRQSYYRHASAILMVTTNCWKALLQSLCEIAFFPLQKMARISKEVIIGGCKDWRVWCVTEGFQLQLLQFCKLNLGECNWALPCKGTGAERLFHLLVACSRHCPLFVSVLFREKFLCCKSSSFLLRFRKGRSASSGVCFSAWVNLSGFDLSSFSACRFPSDDARLFF